jgi:RHS repeat-associated protein
VSRADPNDFAGKTLDYSYDTVDQLTGVDYTGTGTPADESHTYDDSGNRTNTGYTTGDHNRLTADGTYTYQYDANGNRTVRTEVSDGTLTEYGWDHRNRLTSVTFKTSGGTVTKAVQYEYDAYNRLVTKKLDADGNGTFEEKLHWIYDGNQPVLQFDGNTASDLSHRYLWGPAVDQLLADETVDNGGPEDVLWPLTDWQGTVRHLATYVASTDTTTVANEKFYDAYGNVTAETNSAVDTLFAYTGRFFDEDTGLQWNLNRWYDPKTGRWLSEDPIGFAAGDPNLYRYTGNSPADSLDPSGLAPPLTAGAFRDSAGGGFWADQPQADRNTRDQGQRELDAQAARWRQRLLEDVAANTKRAATIAIRAGWPAAKETVPPLKIMVDSAQSAYGKLERGARVAQNARDAGYGPVETTCITGGVLAADECGVTNFSYLLPGSNADVVTGEHMSDSECWLRGGMGTVQLGMTGFMFGRPLRPAPSSAYTNGGGTMGSWMSKQCVAPTSGLSVRELFARMGITTSSTSEVASRTYAIYKSNGELVKFGVTDATLIRYNQSLKMAGPGSYGTFTEVVPKYQAHLQEKYSRSLHYSSTGQWSLPGMKVPHPVDFNTGKPIPRP